jgi:multidrug resistance efflux pump
MRHLRVLLRIALTLATVAVAIVLVAALWRTYMLAPWTRDGRVLAQVVDIAPEVSGTISELKVEDNQFVHKGDLLFSIDPTRFRLAIIEAESQVAAAREQRSLKRSDVQRRLGLTGIVSEEEQERTVSAAAISRAALDGAEATLAVARLNQQRATLFSPVNGYVTHLRLRRGDYISAGQPRIAIIDADSFWINGYFEETKLKRIRTGAPARIKLMGYDAPLTGHVESVGRGISNLDDGSNSLGLPTVNPIFTWVRLAQRIPIRIAIDRVPSGTVLVAGMTASISVGTEQDRSRLRGRLLGWLEDNL